MLKDEVKVVARRKFLRKQYGISLELLLERGTPMVIAFDLLAPDVALQLRFQLAQKLTGGKIIVRSGRCDGDLTNPAAVEAAFAWRSQNSHCLPHCGPRWTVL